MLLQLALFHYFSWLINIPLSTHLSMDLEIVILSEISQTEKNKYDISLICRILKKNDANELIYKTETGFPGGLVVKNLPANSGDERDVGRSLGWENSLE